MFIALIMTVIETPIEKLHSALVPAKIATSLLTVTFCALSRKNVAAEKKHPIQQPQTQARGKTNSSPTARKIISPFAFIDDGAHGSIIRVVSVFADRL